jgi:predicted RNA binding protein YcfA (HicA-like mRNA interferase family)
MISGLPDLSPRERVVSALETLGYQVVRQGNHIALAHYTNTGRQYPLTIPDQTSYKSSAIQAILNSAGIPLKEYMAAYGQA